MKDIKVGDEVEIYRFDVKNGEYFEEIILKCTVTKVTPARIYCGEWEQRSIAGVTRGPYIFNKKDCFSYGSTPFSKIRKA